MPPCPKPDEDRFFKHVEDIGDCWIWIGSRKENGYGQFMSNPGGDSAQRRIVRAHRWAYEFFRADIPDGLVLDHLCRNPPCVNPWHLEPVTRRENVMRGDTIPARNAAKTCCPQGHPYSPQNTIRENNGRKCRTCKRLRDRRRTDRRKRAA